VVVGELRWVMLPILAVADAQNPRHGDVDMCDWAFVLENLVVEYPSRFF
jgi:hypothetical protein